MKDERHLIFFHAPNSRSSGVLALLEELGADYELRVLNLKKGEQRAPAYLAVNPMGKVPALLHGDWLAYYGSCFEPAVIDRSMKRDAAPASTSPYGDFDTMLRTLKDQLECGPYLLGDRFTAADVLWGSALAWTTGFGLVPSSPAIERYLQAVLSRPAMIRARARDAELAAAQA
jgi:glutathione S-transferase